MIALARFEKEDFDQLIEWISTEELMINWAGSLFSFPFTHKSLDWYIKNTNDPETSEAFVYKVIEQETGESIGHISLGSISRKNRSGRISRVLIGSEDHKGKGYCKDMMRSILKIGFDELNLHRISLGVYDFNIAAIKCYEKTGFVTEGVTRDTLAVNNHWWSIQEMSMLENEWKKINSLVS